MTPRAEPVPLQESRFLGYDPGVAATGRTILARGSVLLLLAIAVAVAARFLPIVAWLGAFQTWVEGAGVWGPIVYAAVYALCAVLFIPASLLSLGAGALFGPVLGTVVVLAGASTGAIMSFLLARTLLRGRVLGALSRDRRFASLDRAIAREGPRIVLLVRLSPVFPFTWVNYAFGVTGVRTLHYVIATVIGILPGVIAFVYLGHTAGSVGAETDTLRTTLRVVGALATLAVAIVIGRLARDAIRRAGIDESADSSATEDPPEGKGERGDDRDHPSAAPGAGAER